LVGLIGLSLDGARASTGSRGQDVVPGNNRSFNGRFGYIHYQRNTKNLRFEASDLRGIEKPKAGQLVAFGFCLMAIARMYPAICFRRPTFRSSLN